MAKAKDQSVVSVISGLTKKQAANMLSAITEAKSKHAPGARGTCAVGSIFDVGGLLSSGVKLITGKGGD